MEVNVTELKRNLKKYLDLSQSERVYITRNGKVFTVLCSMKEERVKTMESLFGCIPADITMEESGDERLSRI